MQIRSVGIDLGKTVFHLVALGAAGKVLVRKKFSQRQLLTRGTSWEAPFVCQHTLAPCLIVLARS
jgi:hypothetical protein